MICNEWNSNSKIVDSLIPLVLSIQFVSDVGDHHLVLNVVAILVIDLLLGRC